MPTPLTATCLCGHVSLALQSRLPLEGTEVELSFCHCDSCRHVTGELLVSYSPIEKPPAAHKGVTRAYTTSDGWTRFFCGSCGCHILRSKATLGVEEWEVATGVLGSGTSLNGSAPPPARYNRHIHLEDTKDGGASPWITHFMNRPMESLQRGSSLVVKFTAIPPTISKPQETLEASCACGRVNFFITRPDESSTLPRSNYPDLMHAYCNTDPQKIQNASDEKWWLRDNQRKYLAGTCACRSCRLTSGFEIQTWAFIPRSNISFQVPSSDSTTNTTTIPLDFETLPKSILRSYASSPDVLREFCAGCGATVFWHDRWRPDLIDVSVGLFRADEGARAETWLDWWTGRVSFYEDADGDRGPEGRRASELVTALESGLKAWASPESSLPAGAE